MPCDSYAEVDGGIDSDISALNASLVDLDTKLGSKISGSTRVNEQLLRVRLVDRMVCLQMASWCPILPWLRRR